MTEYIISQDEFKERLGLKEKNLRRIQLAGPHILILMDNMSVEEQQKIAKKHEREIHVIMAGAWNFIFLCFGVCLTAFLVLNVPLRKFGFALIMLVFAVMIIVSLLMREKKVNDG